MTVRRRAPVSGKSRRAFTSIRLPSPPSFLCPLPSFAVFSHAFSFHFPPQSNHLVSLPPLLPLPLPGSSPQGINVADITKLKAAGIVTVLGVAQTPRKNLLKIKVNMVGRRSPTHHRRVSPRQRLRSSRWVPSSQLALTGQEVAAKMLVSATPFIPTRSLPSHLYLPQLPRCQTAARPFSTSQPAPKQSTPCSAAASAPRASPRSMASSALAR